MTLLRLFYDTGSSHFPIIKAINYCCKPIIWEHAQNIPKWYRYWLVVSTPLKIWKSVGMMTFPIYGKIKPCSKPPTSYCDCLFDLYWVFVTWLECVCDVIGFFCDLIGLFCDFIRFFVTLLSVCLALLGFDWVYLGFYWPSNHLRLLRNVTNPMKNYTKLYQSIMTPFM